MTRHLPLFLVGLTLGGLLGCPSSPLPAVGDPCTTADGGYTDGTALCESKAGPLLQCQGNVYVNLSDCKGPQGCSTSNGAVSCDTSGNGLDDHCASEGKVRCSPDAGMILRCIGGVLSDIFDCPSGTHCAIEDGGLSCFN